MHTQEGLGAKGIGVEEGVPRDRLREIVAAPSLGAALSRNLGIGKGAASL